MNRPIVFRRVAGFTLIELVVTITVAAILIGLAAPSFVDFMHRNQVTSQSNEFLGAMRMARATAITKNRFISICPSSNASDASPTCEDSADYSIGWIMYSASASAKEYAAGDTLIRVAQATPGVSLIGQESAKVITFNARGASTSGALAFLLCARKGADTAGQSTLRVPGRRFDIQASGRTGITPLPGSSSPDQAEAYCKPG